MLVTRLICWRIGWNASIPHNFRIVDSVSKHKRVDNWQAVAIVPISRLANQQLASAASGDNLR